MRLPLLPEKHARLNETIIGLGAVALAGLERPQTIDNVWQRVRDLKAKKILPDRVSFEDLVLTLDFLHAIKAVSLNERGALQLCD
jgi:hypothetical protein